MELNKPNLEDLESLVGSYARLTDSVGGFSNLKNENIMPKHNKAREAILDEIIKLLSGK